MKLLHMQSRCRAFTGTGNDRAEGTAVPRIWATEGNLAHACAPEDGTKADTGNTLQRVSAKGQPMPSVVLAPQTAFYRRYTEGLLRRYAVLSMESGRVPSLLGREMFRGKVTSYRVRAFDDVVIFVHDVEKCIGTLSQEQQRLILRIGVQEYTYGEMAARLGCSVRSVQRHYAESLDELTTVFLERRLLERIATEPCQEGALSAKVVSHCPQ